MGNLEVAILGAGVVGVNTALHMQQEFPSANLTLIDDKFDASTLSYGPAGIFRPSSNFGGISIELAKEIASKSYRFYQQLLTTPSCGVTPTSGYIFSNTHANNVKNELLQSILPLYRAATEEECHSYSKSWRYGSYYETLIIRCASFIPWAIKQFKQQNGVAVKQKIANLHDLEQDYDVVFNCAGLGAKYLCDDKYLIPIRGQILKVHAPHVQHFCYDDFDTYILPLGNGDVCLGGSRNYDSYNTEVDHFDTLSIMKRCSSIMPRLNETNIVDKWVGLRPHRNIIRLEVQRLGRLKAIHNYGHCGYGITTAPGTANHVVDLFRSSHCSNSKL